jgi:hypothetical protein
MLIQLKSHTICAAGTFFHFTSKKGVELAVRDAGGTATASLTRSTTLLVMGSGYSDQEQKARLRKLPVLNEDQLIALLATGEIEIEDAAQPEEAPRDALISELRPTIGEPSSASWDAIIEQVDRCPAEQLPELVDYIEAQIGRWVIAPQARWRPQDEDSKQRYQWTPMAPAGELRVAPLHWISDMLQGVDSPKYRLIRAIHLTALGVKTPELIKLLGCAQLVNLRYLDLGSRNKYSASAWKALRTGAATRQLEHLAIAELPDKHLKLLDGDHHLHHLNTLHIQRIDLDECDNLPALYATSWASQVTTLMISDARSQAHHLKQDPTLLPALKTLNLSFDPYGISAVDHALKHMRPCHTLAWSGRLRPHADQELSEHVRHAATGVTTLDLSQIGLWHEGDEPEQDARLQSRWAADLLAHLPGSALIRSVAQVRLGRWWTQELADAIAARGGVATR